MATVVRYRDGKLRLVRWRELVVTVDDEGGHIRTWKYRKKVCPDNASAKRLRLTIERQQSLGRRYQPERERVSATLEQLVLAYVKNSVESGAPLGTQRFRSSMTNAFLKFGGPDLPVSELSLTLLGDYAASLPASGRQATTRHRKLLEAELLWQFAYDRPERFPGVEPPRRLTGRRGGWRAPPPVVAYDAPSWSEVDSMIDALRKPWHRLVATVLRYQGIRVSQALALEWADMDLDAGVLLLVAGRRGAKRGATRAVPLHPGLVYEFRAYGPAKGLVFPGRKGQIRNGGVVEEAFKPAWRRAEIAPEKWDRPAEAGGPQTRQKGRPTHAVRAAFSTGLTQAMVPKEIREYLMGHRAGATIAAYLAEQSKATSPYWAAAVEAIGKVPRIGEAS